MERKIGEIFEYEGNWYQCVKDSMYDYCRGCASFKNLKCTTSYGNRDCSLKATCKKLEKVGEPYERYIGSNKSIKVQRYRLPYRYAILPKEPFMILEPNYKNSIEIEIKQNKEDLEEKNESAEEISIRIANEFEEKLEKHFKEYMDKIDTRKLKPFDIQKAKEGRPVCTRDGRKARIIAFDKKGFRAIVGLVDDGDKETLMLYDEAGRSIGDVSEFDLMMPPEKKEGWVNVYKGIDGITFSKHPYPSKEEAIKNAGIMSNRIDTVKICWEE